jgi:hypothetical protein
MSSAIITCPQKSTSSQRVHWIEIELVGEDNSPVPWEPYRITLPNGDVVRGYLDRNGRARVNGIESAGNCTITFPDLDKDLWKLA